MSVTSPDQPPIELLVIDGGSTDGTVDVIRRFEDKIAFWRSHIDNGAAYALNEGVRRATGDIISLLPADDWIEPGALHAVRDAFSQDPSLEVLSCGTRFAHIAIDGSVIVDAEFCDFDVLELNMQNLVRCPLTAGRFILRRIYEEFNAYDTTYTIGSDLDFLIKVYLKKPHAKIHPNLVYTYRKHSGSTTLGGNPRMILAAMRDNIAISRHYFFASGVSNVDQRELLGLHGRSCARYAWMTLVRGQMAESLRAIIGAIKLSPRWPIDVIVWSAQKWLIR